MERESPSPCPIVPLLNMDYIREICPEAELFVFGSVARGTANEKSDIDVGVIVQDSLSEQSMRDL